MAQMYRFAQESISDKLMEESDNTIRASTNAFGTTRSTSHVTEFLANLVIRELEENISVLVRKALTFNLRGKYDTELSSFIVIDSPEILYNALSDLMPEKEVNLIFTKISWKLREQFGITNCHTNCGNIVQEYKHILSYAIENSNWRVSF